MLVFDGEYSAEHAPGKIWHFSQKITKKTSYERFRRKNLFYEVFLPIFVSLSITFSPRLSEEIRFHFYLGIDTSQVYFQ